MKALLCLVFFMSSMPLPSETPSERDARMEWFREARFGMFIHWGVYAVPAGEWDGTKHGGGVEWIQAKAKIPVPDYEPLKDRFNPVKYDPEAWVRLAKDAGMKYVVITSKHHDGFCLWDSEHTDWDVASTPYGKDLLEPLAEACRRHGLKFCLYHSIMDWHHPDYGTRAPWRGNADNPSPDMDAYTAYMKAQLKELLSDHGDVGILWFDGEWEPAWTHERGIDLAHYVRSLQPDIIINNRVDKGRRGMQGMSEDDRFRGDYGTPEQQIPARGLPGTDWESCMTMNNTWGYSAHDSHWKSTETLIRNLVDVASKGGNYLLNVGPTAEGEIPAPSVERLEGIAGWMETNAESIHGTQPNPFPKTPWGRCTIRPIADGTRLYLHVFDWPEDGRLELRGLTNEITAVRVLARPDDIVLLPDDADGRVLLLPGAAPDPVDSVIAVDILGEPEIEAVPFRPAADGTLTLAASDAELAGETFKLEDRHGGTNVGYWSAAGDVLRFPVALPQAGELGLTLRLACDDASAGGSAEIRLLDEDGAIVSRQALEVSSTGGWETFAERPIGALPVPARGRYTVEIVPVEIPGDGLMNFSRLVLK